MKCQLNSRGKYRDKLKEYASFHGFQQDGVCYIRISWLPDYWRKRLEDERIITRVGTQVDLRNMGVRVPRNILQDAYVTLFYRLDLDKLEI